MMRFATGRLLGALMVLLAKSFVVFALIGLMPGDPIDLLATANPESTAEDVAKLRAIYGVDQPLGARYLNWLEALSQGDLGYSRITHRPVLESMGPALVNTLVLTVPAFLISTVLAFVLGTLAALRKGTWLERGINLFAFAGISVPGFWLGLLLIYIFAVRLGLLPAGGMPRPDGAYPGWAHLVLPMLTLVIVEIGGLTRYVRASMLDVMNQDYIRTAQAKGLATPRIIWTHALRNAMIPLATIIALGFGHLASGATLIETMFGWRGMGRLIYEAIMGNDFNLALACLMLTTVLILVANLLADISYSLLDPRIGLTGTKRE